MIETPDMDAAVFIRMLRDKPVHGQGTDADVTLDAKDGDILILRWSSAKPIVKAGDAELV
jgi:GINS complex subunit 4